jgi:hypothetical protein
LTKRNVPVGHILPTGKQVSHHEIEEQLLSMTGSATDDLSLRHPAGQ